MAETDTASAWERIKDHKVVQWTLAYAAAAYTLLHGTEMLSEALDWPHAAFRVITLLLFLGTPLVAVLSWNHGHMARHRVSGVELIILTVLLTISGSILWLREDPLLKGLVTDPRYGALLRLMKYPNQAAGAN